MAKKHGTLLELGGFVTNIECNFQIIFNKELYVTVSNSTAMSSWEITQKLLNEGKLDLKKLISLKLPLVEWERGFDAAIKKDAFKVLLIP